MPSYGSDAGLEDYLAETGRTLPVEAIPAVVRHYGTLYIDSLEDLYCGSAVSVENSFPRDLWDPTPQRVINAAYEAAYAYATDVPIFSGGGTSGGQVTKERVDVLEVTYAAPVGSWWDNNRYFLPLAYAQLLPFLCIPDEDGDGKCGPASVSAFIV